MDKHTKKRLSLRRRAGSPRDGMPSSQSGHSSENSNQPTSEAAAAEDSNKSDQAVNTEKAAPDVEYFDLDESAKTELKVSPVVQLRRAARDCYEEVLTEIIAQLQGIADDPPFGDIDHDGGEICRPGRLFQIIQDAMEVFVRYRQSGALRADPALEEISWKNIMKLHCDFQRHLRLARSHHHPMYAQRAIVLAQDLLKILKVQIRLRKAQGTIDLEPIGNYFDEATEKEWELLRTRQPRNSNEHAQQQEVAVKETVEKTVAEPPLCPTAQEEVAVEEADLQDDEAADPSVVAEVNGMSQVLIHA